jgi:predicted alpha/beta hydrolase family esterase
MELSVFAMKQISGEERKHGPSYALLMETMGNTFDHASPNTMDKQQWWAAVYHDVINRRACFTFVDHGVGILRSYRFLQRMKHWPGVFTDNGEKLRSLLLGQIPSRTKDKHRGRGLPKAYETWQAGRIKNLVVIANDAYANAEKQEFKQLSTSFDGTIIYWEV